MKIVSQNVPRMEKIRFRHGALSQTMVHYLAEGTCSL